MSFLETERQDQIDLEGMPAEILLNIFDWVCWDDIDLGMLATCRHVRSILQMHPLIQTLAAFTIRHGKGVVEVVEADKPAQTQELIPTSNQPFSTTVTSSIREIAHRPWCTNQHAIHVQTTLMKTMIRIHWTPYLRRDKKDCTPASLRRILRQMILTPKGNEQLSDIMFTIADTTDEYSWTRVQVWPMKGVIIIRDQVFNDSKLINVPIVGCIENAKTLVLDKSTC